MNYLKKVLVYEKHRLLLNTVLVLSFFIGMIIYDYVDEAAILDEPLGTFFMLCLLLMCFNIIYLGSFIAALFVNENNIQVHKKIIKIIYILNASQILFISLLALI